MIVHGQLDTVIVSPAVAVIVAPFVVNVVLLRHTDVNAVTTEVTRDTSWVVGVTFEPSSERVGVFVEIPE